MTNYDLLGCHILGKSFQTTDHLMRHRLEKLPKSLKEFPPSTSGFLFCLSDLQLPLILHHLGATTTPPFDLIIKESRNKIREYYTTAWYESKPEEWEKVRKDPDNERFSGEWFQIFPKALWLALMIDDDESIEIIADWVESWFTIGWMPTPVDTAMGQLLISVAATFRSTPLVGQVEMESVILVCRKKAPKVLFEAWNAARNGNQNEFEKQLEKSVKDFRNKQKEEANPLYALAMFQSIVLAGARKLGRSLPDYSPEIWASLPTSESVGLSPPKLWS